jgi:hypothetical protein
MNLNDICLIQLLAVGFGRGADHDGLILGELADTISGAAMLDSAFEAFAAAAPER